MNAAITMRDYFAAHAPANPPTWFQPVMSMPEPMPPTPLSSPTAAELEELSGHGDWLSDDEIFQPRVIEYVALLSAYKNASMEWKRQRERATIFQWPYAWADGVIAERTRALGSAS